MKNAILILISIIGPLMTTFAQTESKRITPYEVSDLDKFEGTWKANVNGKTFRLVLRKEQVLARDKSLTLIQGYYVYGTPTERPAEKAGKLIKSVMHGTLQQTSNKFDKYTLKFLLSDLAKKERLLNATLELSTTNPNQATMTVSNFEIVDHGTKKDRNMSVPRKVILYRE